MQTRKRKDIEGVDGRGRRILDGKKYEVGRREGRKGEEGDVSRGEEE